ncbi:MAG: transcriptional regulator [Candidatus Nanopelagicales bacterium]
MKSSVASASQATDPATRPAAGPVAGPAGAATRVAAALLEGGPQTAAALATHLELTGTAVRRHLDTLLVAGHVIAGSRAPYGPGAGAPARRGRGRPARVYTLTATGRDAFTQGYDDLAVDALQFLAEHAGEPAVAAFARRRADDLERRYASVRTHSDPATALAEALSADGYAATTVPGPLGVQVCQHHCPVAHVAERFPQLCEAEAEAFTHLLGTHVTRLATIAGGDGVCTTLVPQLRGARPIVPRKDTR